MLQNRDRVGQGNVCERLCVCECVQLPVCCRCVHVCDRQRERESQRERKRVRLCVCGRVRVAGSAWQSVLRGSERGAGWVCEICGGLDGCVCARICLCLGMCVCVVCSRGCATPPKLPRPASASSRIKPLDKRLLMCIKIYDSVTLFWKSLRMNVMH